MSDAVFSVIYAGPLVTLQDDGRPGHLRFGVSASGPMDRLAFDAANAALGNLAGQTAIEVSPGGLVLVCKSGSVTVAVTGGDFVIDHNGHKLTSWTVLTVHAGDRLSISAGGVGSWAYLAFAGAVQSARWLGKQATHSTSGFGGGAVTAGQIITLTDAALRDERAGDVTRPDFLPNGPVRVVLGPQEHCFADGTAERFLAEPFRVTDAYDRMGMRLGGVPLDLKGALSIPSEPIVRGSVQVSGDGAPTVLLADHQTTGGYPKIATVISTDIDRLVQHRAGDILRFSAVSPADAVTIARDYDRVRSEYIGQISVPRGTFEQRLMRENLIHGYSTFD